MKGPTGIQLTQEAIQHRHPYEDVRDTSLFYPLRKLMGVEREGEHPSLRKMSLKVLDRVIQGGAHDPVRPSPLPCFPSIRSLWYMRDTGDMSRRRKGVSVFLFLASLDVVLDEKSRTTDPTRTALAS